MVLRIAGGYLRPPEECPPPLEWLPPLECPPPEYPPLLRELLPEYELRLLEEELLRELLELELLRLPLE